MRKLNGAIKNACAPCKLLQAVPATVKLWLFSNTGPKDAGSSFWLDAGNGEVDKLGSRKTVYSKIRRLCQTWNFSNIRHEMDGLIPAYLTKPKGPMGHHPLIVLPHGGPYMLMKLSVIDEWGQLLANNGYMVIATAIP